MIYSVSRRTDIPAFYSDWFINRIKLGYVDVVNPFNTKQVNRYPLGKNDVDCFVFWTKDATKFIDKLDALENYNYYFQYTVNGYGQDVEPNVPSKRNVIINNFKALSKKIGKEKVIWRYDPIMLTDVYTVEKHISYFRYIASELHNYTEKVVFSFVDLYKKTERNTKDLNLIKITPEIMDYIAFEFSKIAKDYNLKIATCCEAIDLEKYGIEHNKCIDDDLIYRISGIKVSNKRDNQRELCGCVKCSDIGAYNTCFHKCKYCYANFNYKVLDTNAAKHNLNSSLLVGELTDDMKIYETEKEIRNLFD